LWRWRTPRPHRSKKTPKQFEEERRKKVEAFKKAGILTDPVLEQALLKVPRELFIPPDYRDYAYREVSLPLPALEAVISCPRSYPLFYQSLRLSRGDRFLEIGTGSGYGAAVAREVVGKEGLVVSLEVDRSAYAFARSNLHRVGYDDIILIRGDGYLGYDPEAPYDKICVTAAVSEMPPPLLDQLSDDGLAVAPIGRGDDQVLTLIYKDGTTEEIARGVSYVPMVSRRRI